MDLGIPAGTGVATSTWWAWVWYKRAQEHGCHKEKKSSSRAVSLGLLSAALKLRGSRLPVGVIGTSEERRLQAQHPAILRTKGIGFVRPRAW